MRNILGTVPSASKDMVAATVRTIFAQPTAVACRAQLHEVVAILENQFPKAAGILEAAEADVLAHTGFPRRTGARSLPRTAGANQQEIKRRSNVVGIFPDDASVIRLVARSCWTSTTTGPSPSAATSPKNHDRHRHQPEEITQTNTAELQPPNINKRSQESRTYFHHSTGHGRRCAADCQACPSHGLSTMRSRQVCGPLIFSAKLSEPVAV